MLRGKFQVKRIKKSEGVRKREISTMNIKQT